MLAYLIIGYVGVALAFFARWRRQLAVVAVLLVGVLFLPEIQSSPTMKAALRPLSVPLLEFTKVNVIGYGLLLGWLLFDFGRGPRFRWRLADLPVTAMVLVPPVAILLSDGGFNEAFAEFRNLLMVWGVPYFIGRRYLGDAEGCRLAVTGWAIAGLVYMPLCLWEVRLSPQLHNQVYGFHQHDFVQSLRFGGFRPMVFMQHGLSVAVFMAGACLCLFWLWRSDALRRGRWTAIRTNAPLLILAMAGTTVLCRSLGALALGLAGLITLVVSPRINSRIVLAALIAVAPMYVTARITGLWKGDDLVKFIRNELPTERSESLGFRLKTEETLIKLVEKRPLTGMGALKDPMPTDTDGRTVVPDGMWIIWYYNAGLIGLASLQSFFLTPSLLVFRRIRPRDWRRPDLASVVVAAVIIALLSIDSLFNAMLNPFYVALAGALVGWATSDRHEVPTHYVGWATVVPAATVAP